MMIMRLSLNNYQVWGFQRFLAPALSLGFLFFFVKGLVWLAVGGLVVIGIL